MQDKILGRHAFSFNERSNGGEGLTLLTTFIANGDPGGVIINQELTLQSYSNAATFTLIGATLTPSVLRDLANQLEVELIKARNSQ